MPSSRSSSGSSSLEEDDPHQVRDEIDYNNIDTIEPIIRRHIMGEKPNDIDASRAHRLHAIQGILNKLGEGTLTGLEKDFQQHKQIQKAVGPLKRAGEKLLKSRKICSMPLKRKLEVIPPKRKREVDEDDGGRRDIERWKEKVKILRGNDRYEHVVMLCDCEEKPRWPDHPDYIESEVYVTQDDLDKKERRISDLAELEFEHIMTDPGWRESKSGMCNAYWLRRLVVYISRMLTEDGIKCVMDTVSDPRGLFIPEGIPTPVRTLLRNNLDKGRFKPQSEEDSLEEKDFWYLFKASELARQMNRIKRLLRQKDGDLVKFMKSDPDVARIVSADKTKKSAKGIMTAWAAMQEFPVLRGKHVDLQKEFKVYLPILKEKIDLGKHMLEFEKKFSKAVFLLFPPAGHGLLFRAPPAQPPAIFTRKVLDDLCEQFPQLPRIIRRLLPIADIMDPNKPFPEQPPPRYNFENGTFDGGAESLETLFDHEPIPRKGSDSSMSSDSSDESFDFGDDEVDVTHQLNAPQESDEETKSAVHVKSEDAKSVRDMLKEKPGAENAEKNIKTSNHEATEHSMAGMFKVIGAKFIQEYQDAAAPPLTSRQEPDLADKGKPSTADTHAGPGTSRSAEAQRKFDAVVQQEKTEAEDGEIRDRTKIEIAGVRLKLARWSEITGMRPLESARMMIGLNNIKVPGTNGSKSGNTNVKPSGEAAKSIDDVNAANRPHGLCELLGVDVSDVADGSGNCTVGQGVDPTGATEDVGDTDGDAHATASDDPDMTVDDGDADVDVEDNVS